MLDRDHEMSVEYVDAFYGLNKETHMQARHYALYMEDNNSDQFLAFHLKMCEWGGVCGGMCVLI